MDYSLAKELKDAGFPQNGKSCDTHSYINDSTLVERIVHPMLNAFRNSIVFFNSPSDVAEKHIPAGTRIRIGGLVKDGSVVRGDNLKIRFDVTDGNRDIQVAYQGVVPDLFREGQGVVAEGALDGSGLFNADTILAKHDETYMPKEVADALKKSGHWKDAYGQRAAMPVGGGRKNLNAGLEKRRDGGLGTYLNWPFSGAQQTLWP